MSLTDQEFTAIARALSDPRRYSILRDIAAATDALSCSCLGEAEHVSAATISHHVKELENAGLITIARQGRFAQLRFRREVFAAYLARLADTLAPTS